MKAKKLIYLPVFFLSFFNVQAQFFEDSDKFFRENVKDGRVSYSKIKDNPATIRELYTYIGDADITGMSDAERKAFYINAYNLIVIYQVSKYYPLKSPMDASGFFDGVKHKVAGESLTLNALEIKKLLRVYNDARIHFALACAARSCPKLASFAYLPASLEKQLDERTRLAINDAEWLRIDKPAKTANISKIFDWYKDDFLSDSGSIRAYINKFRAQDIPENYKLEFYEYNWQLND